MKLILIGFGVVGQGFAEILVSKATQLEQEQDFAPLIVGVVTATKGTLFRDAGLDIRALLAATQAGSFDAYPAQVGLRRDMAASDMIAAESADALVEATIASAGVSPAATISPSSRSSIYPKN